MILEGVAWSREVYTDDLDELRFAVLEPGKPFKEKPASYWRSISGSEELANQLATAAGIRSQTLTGFTLFFHHPKGWQMSVRRENEQGWDVGFIDEDKARAVLALLANSGHPDGPWTVKTMDARPSDLVEECPECGDRHLVSFHQPPNSDLAANRAAQDRLKAALAAWMPA